MVQAVFFRYKYIHPLALGIPGCSQKLAMHFMKVKITKKNIDRKGMICCFNTCMFLTYAPSQEAEHLHPPGSYSMPLSKGSSCSHPRESTAAICAHRVCSVGPWNACRCNRSSLRFLHAAAESSSSSFFTVRISPTLETCVVSRFDCWWIKLLFILTYKLFKLNRWINI